mmetsp:Transcript_779/g.2827  ORF Transcript_779/g.2827 Transcript_779/m.2827 type:complete len:213 (-) Transcript_779:1271-1909(-)
MVQRRGGHHPHRLRLQRKEQEGRGGVQQGPHAQPAWLPLRPQPFHDPRQLEHLQRRVAEELHLLPHPPGGCQGAESYHGDVHDVSVLAWILSRILHLLLLLCILLPCGRAGGPQVQEGVHHQSGEACAQGRPDGLHDLHDRGNVDLHQHNRDFFPRTGPREDAHRIPRSVLRRNCGRSGRVPGLQVPRADAAPPSAPGAVWPGQEAAVSAMR